MNRIMGGAQNFYFPACSGDTSDKIMTQIQNLPSGLDLVVMTADGNDMCLVSPQNRDAEVAPGGNP
jgi:hypothetical protein